MDYGNTKTLSTHRRLGSTTLSQLAFPAEGNPNFPWEKSPWDDTVGKKQPCSLGSQDFTQRTAQFIVNTILHTKNDYVHSKHLISCKEQLSLSWTPDIIKRTAQFIVNTILHTKNNYVNTWFHAKNSQVYRKRQTLEKGQTSSSWTVDDAKDSQCYREHQSLCKQQQNKQTKQQQNLPVHREH